MVAAVKWLLPSVIPATTLLLLPVMSLKCYECDNQINTACGVNFKSYQFAASTCKGKDVKCGLQRQLPIPEKKNFVGMLRACYRVGTIQGINETDGCRYHITQPMNYTAKYCFCSTDYCNAATWNSSSIAEVLVSAILLAVFYTIHR